MDLDSDRVPIEEDDEDWDDEDDFWEDEDEDDDIFIELDEEETFEDKMVKLLGWDEGGEE